MSDFETHSIGTSKEIQLSRKLVNLIDKEMGNKAISLSEDTKKAYYDLLKHYQWQMEYESH